MVEDVDPHQKEHRQNVGTTSRTGRHARSDARNPGQASIAYLLALLLIRRRILMEAESFSSPNEEAQPAEPTHLELRFLRMTDI